MRVLQVSKFYAPVVGGIETAARELVEGLSRAGLRVDVLCANQRATTDDERFPGGYRVVRAASLGTVQSTSLSPALVQHMRIMAADSDVVHVHMPNPMAAAALWVVRPRGCVVVHWHSDVVRQQRALYLYGPLQRWMLKRADAIITTSQRYAEASGPLQPWRSKLHVIPIGLSDHRPDAALAQASQLRQRFAGRRIVFALGRMTYYKGFEVLIEASARLPEDCVVLIGGAGEYFQRHQQQIIARGLQHKVQLLGYIPSDQLPGHYEACDVFCMPSTARSEAYGIAMVEAMMRGKPVVASDIVGSGMPWVNSGTGFNVPVGHAMALSETLRLLLDDTALRTRLGAASRSRYLQEFRSELMSARTLALYRQLVRAV